MCILSFMVKNIFLRNMYTLMCIKLMTNENLQ